MRLVTRLIFLACCTTAGSASYPMLAQAAPPSPALKTLLAPELQAAGLSPSAAFNAPNWLSQEEGSLARFEIGPYEFQVDAANGVSLRGDRLESNAALREDPELRAALNRATLALIDNKQTIIYRATVPTRHTLTVFTDVTCPYSAELHRELDLLTGEGVTVRYLAYPYLGEGSLGAHKMAAIWCNAQRNQAFDLAVEAERFPITLCEQPLEGNLALATALGIYGTPTLLFENGTLVTGYNSAVDILAYLEQGIPLSAGGYSSTDTPAAAPDEAAPVLPLPAPTAIRAALASTLHELRLEAIDPQQLVLQANAYSYQTEAGSYLLQITPDGSVMHSNLLDKPDFLDETRRASVRRAALQALSPSSTINFSPDPIRHHIYAFIDVGCPFCQTQYQEMPKLLAAGVQIHYLAYPRAGLDSPAYQALAAIWCSADPGRALLNSEHREQTPTPACDTHPVSAHYELGNSLGVRGTPSLVLDTGELLTGYSNAAHILKQLAVVGQPPR